MSVIFRKPPLIEALCEFHFVSKLPWDWTVPGLMYAQVKDEFPVRQEEQGYQAQVDPDASRSSRSDVNTIRVQFVREDRSALIQIAPDLLVVNHLLPYPHWESFKTLIFKIFDTYVDIVRPEAVRGMALRYINKLEVSRPPSGTRFKAEEYCNVVPGVPESLLAGSTYHFVQRVDIRKDDVQSVLAIQSGIGSPSQEDNIAYLVDLEFTTMSNKPFPTEMAQPWVERAHSEVERAFLECFTEKAKLLFQPADDVLNS